MPMGNEDEFGMGHLPEEGSQEESSLWVMAHRTDKMLHFIPNRICRVLTCKLEQIHIEDINNNNILVFFFKCQIPFYALKKSHYLIDTTKS